MTRLPSKKLSVGLLTPGLHGGVDEAARYVHESDTFEQTRLKMYRTKGLSVPKAPFRFAFTMTQICFDRFRGHLDVAHVNVSAKGSTLRKVLLSTLLRLLGVPYVVQIHSGRYQQFWNSMPKIGRICTRPLFHNASRTLILGHTFHDFVTDEIGVDAERVVVVPNGVPVPATIPQQRSTIPTVLFLGRLDHNKGYQDVLAALDRCTDLDWSAVLMGNGETEQAKELVEQYGLSERVLIKGWTDRLLVDKALQNSAILVSPSRLEALSMTLLEAMAHGLACVATPVGAHTDVLANELNALTVQPGEIDQLSKALRRLLSSPDLRHELGSAARDEITRWFSIETVCSRLENLYHQTFSESS